MDSQPTPIWAYIYVLTGREIALAQTCRRGAKFSFRVRFILHHCEQLRKIQQIVNLPKCEYKSFVEKYKMCVKHNYLMKFIYGICWNDNTTIAEYGGQINKKITKIRIKGKIFYNDKCVNYEYYGEVTATLHANKYYRCVYCEKYTVGSELPNCARCAKIGTTLMHSIYDQPFVKPKLENKLKTKKFILPKKNCNKCLRGVKHNCKI
jgi:hypothetical protein